MRSSVYGYVLFLTFCKLQNIFVNYLVLIKQLVLLIKLFDFVCSLFETSRLKVWIFFFLIGNAK